MITNFKLKLICILLACVINLLKVDYAVLLGLWGYGVQRHFQQYVSYIVAISFIGGRYPQKTTDLSQVTDKLYHIMYSQL